VAKECKLCNIRISQSEDAIGWRLVEWMQTHRRYPKLDELDEETKEWLKTHPDRVQKLDRQPGETVEEAILRSIFGKDAKPVSKEEWLRIYSSGETR
jgi:hypothetical protein